MTCNFIKKEALAPEFLRTLFSIEHLWWLLLFFLFSVVIQSFLFFSYSKQNNKSQVLDLKFQCGPEYEEMKVCM